MAKRRFEDDNTEIDNTAIYEIFSTHALLCCDVTMARNIGQPRWRETLSEREDRRELFKG